MNFAPLFRPLWPAHVNPWEVLTLLLAGFFGAYLGVRFAVWRMKKK